MRNYATTTVTLIGKTGRIMDEHLLRFDKKKEIVLIDFETENLCLHNFRNLPWQVAMLKVKGDKKIAEKDLWLSWDRKLQISKEAARITRFSPAQHKKKALPAKEVFPTIKDWLNNADYIMGHNILGFDIYLIKDYYELMGEDYAPLVDKTIDTMCLARGVKTGLRLRSEESLLAYQYKMLHTRRKGLKTNLKAMGKEYEIDHDYDNLHNALVDLELNLKVWNKLKWQVDI